MTTQAQPTMTKFSMIRDINGYNGFGLPFSNVNYQFTVSQATPTTLTIPIDYTNCLAIFSYGVGTNVWVANNVTATLPTGTVSATPCQQNPTARWVKSGDVLSFNTSNTTADVGVMLYSLPWFNGAL